MKQSAISFESQDLELEGVFGLPDEPQGPVAGVVLCHPHPLMGGTMDNPVVLAVYFALLQQGLAALRFNFRGVGGSQGVRGKGEEEPADVKSALELLKNLPGVDRRRLGLAGYSFGAGMILAGVSRYSACKCFALISPPPRFYKDTALSKDKRPKLLISGDQDRSVPAEEFSVFAESLPQPVEFKLVPGADHFWGRHVQEAASKVADFFGATLT